MAKRASKPSSKNAPASRGGGSAKPPKIVGERSVRRTAKTVPVESEADVIRGEPKIAPIAIDRRKQFTGTDEHSTDRPPRGEGRGG